MKKYDREKLYQEVWKEPVSIVAKRYDVSDTALAKVCRRMNIPLPPRGYWAKIRAGQSVSIPILPTYEPNKPIEQPKKEKKKLERIPKSNAQREYEEKRIQRINAFLHCHMVEKEDILHHFKYLISCLKKKEYADYPEEFKTRRTAFLQECMDRIKAAHLPALVVPWTYYECNESPSGFSLSIAKTTAMDVVNDEINSECFQVISDIMEFPYDYSTIAEYAKLHSINEKMVVQWIESGRLAGAIYEDGKWKIPELELRPEDEDYPVFMELYPDNPVDIPAYPLLSQCSELHIIPDGRKYRMEYYGKDREWIGELFITQHEKDSLMGELLKQNAVYDYTAYEIAFYSIKKHHEIDIGQWHDVPSCK